jgi:hypothetical protein
VRCHRKRRLRTNAPAPKLAQNATRRILFPTDGLRAPTLPFDAAKTAKCAGPVQASCNDNSTDGPPYLLPSAT